MYTCDEYSVCPFNEATPCPSCHIERSDSMVETIKVTIKQDEYLPIKLGIDFKGTTHALREYQNEVKIGHEYIIIYDSNQSILDVVEVLP